MTSPVLRPSHIVQRDIFTVLVAVAYKEDVVGQPVVWMLGTVSHVHV